MIRKLLVELERLWPCYDDGSQRPIDEQALIFGAVVSSGDVVKQESPAVSGISPESDNLGLVLFPWQRKIAWDRTNPSELALVAGRLFPFISDFNLSGLLNSSRMVISAVQSVGSPCKRILPSA